MYRPSLLSGHFKDLHAAPQRKSMTLRRFLAMNHEQSRLKRLIPIVVNWCDHAQ